MSTIHDLFVHDLEDVYYAENELHDALEDLADHTSNDEIAEAFREHREETQQHIDRLEQVFDIVDHEIEREECEGIEGLITEHEEFVEDVDPDQGVLDLHNVVAAQKTEHYEIAAYGNLGLFADRLGYDEAGDLLHQNLEEEEAALEELTALVERFDFVEKIESPASD